MAISYDHKKARKKLPLVSVIVPTYNQSAYLWSCLDSLMHQCYSNLEIIVADDASPDSTREVTQDYMAKLEDMHEVIVDSRGEEIVREVKPRYPVPRPKIRYFRNQENLGASGNYNAGFSKAKGEYVTFVPSDDIVLPTYIAELVGALEKGYDFAYSDFILIDDMVRINAYYRLPEYDFTACLAKWYRLGPSHLFRKALFDAHGGFDSTFRLANDYDLFLRFAIGGARFVHIPQALYYKRSHEKRRQGQWSLNNYDRIIEESIQCANRAREWISTKNEARQSQ
jgi:glycosyltransferase involved in cell wall biosynthesis